MYQEIVSNKELTGDTKWILDRDASSSAKIKMLNNLVQVYEQYKMNKESV